MTRIITKTIEFILLLVIVTSCGDTPKTNNINELKEKVSLDTNVIDQPDKYSEIGYKLMKNESLGEINLNLESKKVIEFLGEPDEKTKAELWGADGAYHQQWKYLKKGIELDIIGELNNNLRVNLIAASEPCKLKTKRNIGVGSSFEDVQNAYKSEINPTISSAETVVAGTFYGGVVFRFVDNKVQSIFIGASAE